MTGAYRTPNFRGWRVAILHREDANAARLERQLARLGIVCVRSWPALDLADGPFDAVFFDGDAGFDGQFPWANEDPPIPMIAIVGSEAPGRLEWALAQGARAHIVKPVSSSGVFSALVLASALLERHRRQARRIADLEKRLSGRPQVIDAVIAVMAACGLDQDTAFARIRSAAMNRRQTVEAFCAARPPADIAHLVARDAPRRQTG